MSVLSLLTNLAQSSYDLTSSTMSSQDTGAALVATMIIYVFTFLFIGLPSIITLWSLFKKAGEPGWASIVPIYNTIVILKIAGKPLWWFILLLVPFLNFIFSILVLIEFAKKYDKASTIVTLVLIPIISVFLVKNTKYIGGGKTPAAPAA